MRVAILSPYSWTYPGGVTRHIEALAERFMADGHHVRVLAPFDPPDRFASVLHRGARPQPMARPDYLVPLGRSLGLKANQAVSNVSITPYGLAAAQHELRTGRYDVLHVHEPLAPVAPWCVTDRTSVPVVGTFHTYNENRISNGIANVLGARRMLNRLHVRIAVSEAAAWTARRFFGGHYRVIPNGVHVDPRQAALASLRPQTDRLKIAFVGQAVERKGLPLLLRAFEALREHIPTELTVIGPSYEELAPVLMDSAGVRMLGKVSDEVKRAELEAADVLCAPSLSGESFGMVLTEAFAAGTPVIASAIAGYSDVVSDGVDGLLVPPGDPQRLAEELQRVHHEPERLGEMGRAARRSAQRYAWPRVADQVTEVYERAIEAPKPTTAGEKFAHWAGIRPADGNPQRPAERLPSLDPAPAQAGRRGRAVARRVALGVAGLLGIGLTFLAAQKIGIDNVVESIVRSNLTWVLIACALMASSLFFRAASRYCVAR